ncbi:helix-turn-helix domain-containing protein [Streptomyces ardesiacus]
MAGSVYPKCLPRSTSPLGWRFSLCWRSGASICRRGQAYRLVAERPERLSMKTLMALLDILGCSMGELIEPVPVAAGRGRKAASGAAGADGGSSIVAAWLMGRSASTSSTTI